MAGKAAEAGGIEAFHLKGMLVVHSAGPARLRHNLSVRHPLPAALYGKLPLAATTLHRKHAGCCPCLNAASPIP